MAGQGTTHRLGWLGTGRMGTELARRLLAADCDVAVYNRTRAKAEPLAAYGAKIANAAAELADRDIVFATVGTPQDLLDAVLARPGSISGGGAPEVVVDAPRSRWRPRSGCGSGWPRTVPHCSRRRSWATPGWRRSAG